MAEGDARQALDGLEHRIAQRRLDRSVVNEAVLQGARGGFPVEETVALEMVAAATLRLELAVDKAEALQLGLLGGIGHHLAVLNRHRSPSKHVVLRAYEEAFRVAKEQYPDVMPKEADPGLYAADYR